MLPDRVSNPGPLTCESGALPIALHGPADIKVKRLNFDQTNTSILFEHIKEVIRFGDLDLIFNVTLAVWNF